MDEKNAIHRVVNDLDSNAHDLERELEWFAKVLDSRLKLYFGTENTGTSVFDIPPPDLSGSNSCYARLVRHYTLSTAERLVLLLALIPHIRPQILDVLWSKNETTDRGFTEFGGLRGSMHSGFIPTGETALFILAGDDLAARFDLTRLFEGDHFFSRHNILHLSPVPTGEPFLSGALTISREYLQWFTTAVERKPNFNNEFPARLIETQFDWDNLVLPYFTI